MKQLLIFSAAIFLFACSGKPTKEKEATTSGQKEAPSEQKKSAAPEKSVPPEKTAVPESKMIYFEGGSFLMGSKDGLPNERPVHEVTIAPFYMDKSPVTVARFRQFVEATGFKTEAEKFGDSGVFNLEKQNWELLPGATWRKPFGPSGPAAEDDHPVTHVSWNDAVAYAEWAGKRLPTEAEWEYAARSGKNLGEKFSWGDQVAREGDYFANTWQGTLRNPETKDGYLFTSPVGAFGENDAGLTDMGGNVWEWCADTYQPYPGSNQPYRKDPKIKVIRGGSFFYDRNGEDSFSVSGRSMNSHETSLFNTGFRCTRDATPKN